MSQGCNLGKGGTMSGYNPIGWTESRTAPMVRDQRVFDPERIQKHKVHNRPEQWIAGDNFN